MADPYSDVSITNYNANPPSDDGAQVPANLLAWSKHIDKIGNPLKTAIEEINTNVGAAVDKLIGGGGLTNSSLTYDILASDQGKTVRATGAGGITFTTPDATAVGSPFMCGVRNDSSGLVTLEGNGSQTVDGAANIVLGAGVTLLLFTDGSNWFTLGRLAINALTTESSPDGAADYVAIYDGSTGALKKVLLGNLQLALPRGHIDGCILSNGDGAGAGDQTNDITISAGVCRDSTNAVNITVAAATKQLDANWVAGTTGGMRNSAAGITDTTYHIYAVMTAAGVVGIYAHTSTTVATVLTALQAETGGTDYIYARRIGSIMRESAAIVGFVQYGDHFQRTVLHNITVTNPGASAVTRTLGVPIGVRVKAQLYLSIEISSGTTIFFVVTDLSVTDQAPTSQTAHVQGKTTGSLAGGSAEAQVWTNTSGQVRTRASSVGSTTEISISTRGWIDPRGKDA